MNENKCDRSLYCQCRICSEELKGIIKKLDQLKIRLESHFDKYHKMRLKRLDDECYDETCKIKKKYDEIKEKIVRDEESDKDRFIKRMLSY
jgi:hypothetical protein